MRYAWILSWRSAGGLEGTLHGTQLEHVGGQFTTRSELLASLLTKLRNDLGVQPVVTLWQVEPDPLGV